MRNLSPQLSHVSGQWSSIASGPSFSFLPNPGSPAVCPDCACRRFRSRASPFRRIPSGRLPPAPPAANRTRNRPAGSPLWCIFLSFPIGGLNRYPDIISKPIKKLKENLSNYSKAYDLPGCHRTGNMIERFTRRMDRHPSSTFFHGNLATAELSIRGWALIHNFAPRNPKTVKEHDGLKSPAEWLNKSRYHENRLQSLLTSASMGESNYSRFQPRL